MKQIPSNSQLSDLTFHRFTLIKLNQLLLRHSISEPGRSYISRAYDAPSRNVQGGTKNVVSHTPCPKMAVSMPSESGSVEFKFCLSHVFDSQTLGYLLQPPALELRYHGRNGKRVRSLYTPDCVRFDLCTGIWLEEYKSASERGTLIESHPGKYVLGADGVFTSPPAEELIGPWGFRFRVRFDDEIHPITHANRSFLFNYVGTDSHFEWKQIKGELLPRFTTGGMRHYDELIDEGVVADDLNWAIANGHLHVDLKAALLDREAPLVQVFTSPVLLEAWTKSVRPNGTRPSPNDITRDELAPGSKFLFDGLTLTVKLAGVNALHAFDESGRPLSFTYQELNAARDSGTLALPSDFGDFIHPGPLWNASQKEIERALNKLKVLDALDRGESLPPDRTYSSSTVRRWRKQIADGETKGLSAIESLIGAIDSRGYRGPHIDPEYDKILNEWITEQLSSTICPTIESLFQDSKVLSVQYGFEPIGRSSFYARVEILRSVDTIRKSAGHKNAYQISPSYWLLEKDTPLHGIRAMEMVHIDSSPVDVDLSSSISGDKVPKAWLTLAMCANTRRVVGMHLSFSPPSHVSSMMVLADIIRRTGRLPDAVIHDWGSEFKAKCLADALTAFRIIQHIRPKSSPRHGAILERMFGVVTKEFFDNVMGNTKLRKKVRSLTPLVDPSRFNGLWLIDIYQALEEYFFDIYDKRKHPATNLPPRDAYDRSLLVHGNRIHRCRSLDSVLSIILPPPKSARGNQVDPARGIFVNGRHYGHPLIANFALRGTTPPIRPNPFNPGNILAFINKTWVYCKSNLSSRVDRLPHPVRACLFEELRIERLIAKDSSDRSRERVLKLCKAMNEKALQNIAYWEEPEEEEILETGDPDEFGSDVHHSSAYGRLNEMVRKAVSKHLEAAV